MVPTLVNGPLRGSRSARRTRPAGVLRRAGRRERSRCCPFRPLPRCRGSRRARPARSPSGSPRATCTTFGSTAASKPSIRRCVTSARGFTRNNVVHAQHWRHDDGPHPTLCVIHGFMGSPYLFNGLFFSLPWFYRSGYDVLLYTMPFHGSRAEKGSPFSGYGFFANGFSGFAEAMAQPCTISARSSTIWSSPVSTDRTDRNLAWRLHPALIASVDDRHPGGHPQRSGRLARRPRGLVPRDKLFTWEPARSNHDSRVRRSLDLPFTAELPAACSAGTDV